MNGETLKLPNCQPLTTKVVRGFFLIVAAEKYSIRRAAAFNKINNTRGSHPNDQGDQKCLRSARVQ
jgi:hypothetical protein